MSVSNELAPAQLGSVETKLRYAEGMAFRGDTAYVAGGPDGLVAVNLSRPQEPEIEFHASWEGMTSDVATDGSLLLVARGEEGLWMMDADGAPEVTRMMDWPRTVRKIVHWKTRWIAGTSSEEGDALEILEIESSGEPVLISRTLLPGSLREMELQGDRLHVLASNRYLSFDLKEDGPPNPVASLRLEMDAKFLMTGSSGNWVLGDQGLFQIVETPACQLSVPPNP